MYYKNSQEAIYGLSTSLIKETMIRSNCKTQNILIHGKSTYIDALNIYGRITDFKELDQIKSDMQFDTVISDFELLFSEDTNSELMKYKMLLKERSLLIINSLSANLHELTNAFIIAQQNIEKCAYNIFVQMPSCSSLVYAATSLGFSEIVSYTEHIQIDYSSFKKMLMDIEWLLKKPLKEDLIKEAEKSYKGSCSILFEVSILSSTGHRC
ncbi:hypothetical protein Cyrtocomes_00380 [Candidatus Cyrtobacter comes]|uniref:Uncharacterized protein n=1 Tax=Candidatus Cyrtobacter comes TaxID=675776 RepID=A0ABU5L7B2_9RICK|nr:hypothetical protein [Candidatus Cyrtobacter comes]MDZ5762014.1 hypothetical protein [Candidatus Cyrtobacter comes]